MNNIEDIKNKWENAMLLEELPGAIFYESIVRK
jgi:hypothetical protein